MPLMKYGGANMSKEPIEKKDYSMNYVCDNCGKPYWKVFEFGERAYKGICPHCGVSNERGYYDKY